MGQTTKDKLRENAKKLKEIADTYNERKLSENLKLIEKIRNNLFKLGALLKKRLPFL